MRRLCKNVKIASLSPYFHKFLSIWFIINTQTQHEKSTMYSLVQEHIRGKQMNIVNQMEGRYIYKTLTFTVDG